MKIRIILIISYLLLYFSPAYAQKGCVTDSKSHTPISDVNIFLSKDKGLSISGKDGCFDAGDWILHPSDTIHFSHVGYATKSITYAALQSYKYQVLMEETVENLNNITVTASKIERKASLETQKLASMPYGVYAYGSILVNGKIYITGGDESFYQGSLASPFGTEGAKASNKPNRWIGFLPKMQIYDIKTDSWSVSTQKFRERAYHTLAVYDNKLLIMGGIRWSANRRKQYLDETIEWYDIKHDVRSIDKTNPHQAVSPASFIYENNVILMGGAISE